VTVGRPEDWCEVSFVILAPGERAPAVPDDTQGVPLEARVRGFLTAEAHEGEAVEIETLGGRRISGRLERLWPAPQETYGPPSPELLEAARQLLEQARRERRR
jgi:2-amino-4-ketopentanoate thiolase alpha subunit